MITTLIVVDEQAGRDVRQYSTLHGIYRVQMPSWWHTALTPLAIEAVAAMVL
jgi:hypothetical protein